MTAGLVMLRHYQRGGQLEKSVEDKDMTTSVYIELEPFSCGNCGCVFGLSAEHIRTLRQNHETFYCPNGHARYFPGKNEAEKLRDELALLQKREETKARYIANLEADKQALERSRNSLRGVVARTKQRISKGKCPCCHDTFKNLADHMITAHPTYATAAQT